MKILVTGGTGFIGFALCRRLLAQGHEVIVNDHPDTVNNYHGRELDRLGAKVILLSLSRLSLTRSTLSGLDQVYHLACPASPKDFSLKGEMIIDACGPGTQSMLYLAKTSGAKFLLASSSEVYGDPQVHPQHEDYRGNVSTTGHRSVYDEGKRFAEAITDYFSPQVDTRIARIFNTYGPGMRLDDGRAIPAFLSQSFAGLPLTVHGDGKQTRCFTYIDDMVDGLVSLMRSTERRPTNLGSTTEIQIDSLARMIADWKGLAVEYVESMENDPRRRKPDITRARTSLGWSASTPISRGIKETYEHYERITARQD